MKINNIFMYEVHSESMFHFLIKKRLINKLDKLKNNFFFTISVFILSL